MSHSSLPFFGKTVFREQEKELIEKILSKYRLEPVSQELKNKIYNELMHEKHHGTITIPFKVILRKDPSGIHRDFIEILLDTKV